MNLTRFTQPFDKKKQGRRVFLYFFIQPIKSLLDYRAEKDASRRDSGSGGGGDPESELVPSSSSDPLTPSKSGSAGASASASYPRSVYREILYLTLVSLGQGQTY